MYAVRVALRRTTTAAAVMRMAAPRAVAVRYATAAAAAEVNKGPDEVCRRTNENVDVVRDAISKMLHKAADEVKPISNEELESSLARFAHLYEEARACINDCKEARAGSLEFYEEAYTAQRAVDQVFSSYTDLLDDFRRASDDQLKELCQDRIALASTLKSLRQEVHEISQPKQKAA